MVIIVSIPECGYITRPGEPFLPYKSIVIILPPDQTLDYIEVQWLEMHEIPGKYFIAPAPEPVTIDTSTDPVKPDRIIYNQSEPYPGTLYSYMPKVHMLRGYKFVIVTLYPVHYIPSTGKIIFYSKFKITVHLKDDKLSIAKPTRHIINWLQKIALNPEMLHKYMIANSSSNGYLIITRPMFSSILYDLENILGEHGFTVYVKYVDDIVNEYSGEDTPEKIRNCIIDYYWNYDVSYVLLIGDADPDDLSMGYALDKTWEVPTRYVYNPDPDNGYDEYFTGLPNDYTPTDYYYAGLDGTWDSDNDGNYGESRTYSDTGVDEADWFTEVYVGRVAVRTPADAENYVNKLISYYNSFPVRNRQMLLLGAELYDSDPNYYTDGAWLCEKVKKIYPLEISKYSLYESGGNLTYDNVIIYLNYDPIFVHSSSHGSPDKLWLYRTYDWLADTSTPNYISGTGIIWYAEACLSGAYDMDETLYVVSFAEAMIRDPDGSSIAHIASTRVSWIYISEWYLYGLDGRQYWLFWYWLYELSKEGVTPRPGLALYQAKMNYYIQYSDIVSSYEDHRKVLFAQMLLGDPATPVTKGNASIYSGYNYEIGDKIIIEGTGFTPFTPVNIYFEYEVPVLPEGTVNVKRIHVSSALTDASGNLIACFYVPYNITEANVYDVMIVDQYGNYVFAGKIFVNNVSLTIRTNVGHGRFIATVTGYGFAPYSTVKLYMNGTLIAEYMADENGSLSGIIMFPLASPGTYQVIAVDDYGNTGYELIHIISSYIMPVDITIDVGSIHFAGETAEFYILTTFIGSRVDANIDNVLLYYGGDLVVNLTTEVERIDTGFHKVNYRIPLDADEGVYTILVEASYSTGLIKAKGSSIRSFLISPTLTEWGAILTDIQGNVAIIKTDVGYVKLTLDNLNMTIYDIRNNTAYVATEIGDIKADLDSLRGFLQEMNATMVDIIGRTYAVIRACNTTIITRLDLFNASLIELALSSKGEILAKLDTILGTLSAKLDTLNAEIIGVNNNTVIIRTTLEDMQVNLDEIRDLVEEVNASIEGIEYDGVSQEIRALINICNSTIPARLDALKTRLLDAILTSKGKIILKLNTSIGVLTSKLDKLNLTIIGIKDNVGEIISSVKEIESTIRNWTGETITLYGHRSLILTTSTIVDKPQVSDEIIKIGVSGSKDIKGSLVMILPKILLNSLGITVNDIAVLIDGCRMGFDTIEHNTYYILRFSYSPNRHEVVIYLKGMLDEDRDSIKNYEEYIRGFNPENPDTDGDFFSDSMDPWPLNPYMPLAIIVVPIIIALTTFLIILGRRKRFQ